MDTRHDAEDRRLRGTRQPWKKWGPYVSERQWGTVREAYSQTDAVALKIVRSY
jgi:hypothetical protein